MILTSAASLRILGIRVYTYFIDLLAPKDYYLKKIEELNISPQYPLEPISLRYAEFPIRLGTVEGNLCSFRHMIKPYNVYVEVEIALDDRSRLVKIRPHEYVRRDYDNAIESMIQRFDESYWKDFYNYHRQIEAIDLGMRRETMKVGPQKMLELE
jgi:hypothetical protein